MKGLIQELVDEANKSPLDYLVDEAPDCDLCLDTGEIEYDDCTLPCECTAEYQDKCDFRN